MRVSLICHPDTPCDAVRGIQVTAQKSDGVLDLAYGLDGDMDAVRWPLPAESARTDELWRHTCFEVFAASHDGSYLEFNLAPSSQWAAYRFTAYRKGMQDADITLRGLSLHGSLFRASIPLSPWPERFAVTAVIEETNGRKSYWSLRHPPGKPDFHHPDGFILQLP